MNMIVDCQVTQPMAGRIHLHAASMATDPEIHARLIHLLMHLPGIRSIEIEPASASVVIKHDLAPGTRDAILLALRGSATPTTALTTATHPGALARSATERPYAACAMIHATHGRVRLGIPVVGADGNLAGVLEEYVRQQPGIVAVHVNRFAESVVIHFDPTVQDPQSLVALVQGYTPGEEEIARWQSAVQAEATAAVAQRGRLLVEAVTALLALALSFYGAGLAILLALLLLVASSWRFVQRAYRSLHDGRKMTGDLLIVAALGVLCLFGMLWQAALIALVLAIALLLRSYAPGHAGRPFTVVVEPAAKRDGPALGGAREPVMAELSDQRTESI